MPKPPSVFRYRVRNWREYNHALIKRGRLIVWFDEHTVTAWRNTEPAAGPGAPRLYADLAIECALVFKSVYHLSLRAAQGFLSSIMELMRLTLPVPDYSRGELFVTFRIMQHSHSNFSGVMGRSRTRFPVA